MPPSLPLPVGSSCNTPTASPEFPHDSLHVKIRVGSGLKVCQVDTQSMELHVHGAQIADVSRSPEEDGEALCVQSEPPVAVTNVHSESSSEQVQHIPVEAKGTSGDGSTAVETNAATLNLAHKVHEHSLSSSTDSSLAVCETDDSTSTPVEAEDSVKESVGAKGEDALTNSSDFSREFFNSKYMYKEYNLRQTRKRTDTCTLQSPAKKKKTAISSAESSPSKSSSIAPAEPVATDTLTVESSNNTGSVNSETATAEGSRKRHRPLDCNESQLTTKQAKMEPVSRQSPTPELSVKSPQPQIVSVDLHKLGSAEAAGGAEANEKATGTVKEVVPSRRSTRHIQAKSKAEPGNKDGKNHTATEREKKDAPAKSEAKDTKCQTDSNRDTDDRSLSVFDFDESSAETTSSKPKALPVTQPVSHPAVQGRKPTRKGAKDQKESKQHQDIIVCALCKLPRYAFDLGFLFGPYRYRQKTTSPTQEPPNSDIGGEIEHQGQHEVKTASDLVPVELWVHEECAVWAPGVCLVGRDLKGLLEATSDGEKMVSALWNNIMCAVLANKVVIFMP